MISLELAKKLQEAGYWQYPIVGKFVNWYCQRCQGLVLPDPTNPKAKRCKCTDEAYYSGEQMKAYNAQQIPVPNLEQLLDACGDWFGGLLKIENSNNWRAFRVVATDFYDGQYPAEAVAALWLARKEKAPEGA